MSFYTLTVHFTLVSEDYLPPPTWGVRLQSFLEGFLDVW